jgi:hypothetical protein
VIPAEKTARRWVQQQPLPGGQGQSSPQLVQEQESKGVIVFSVWKMMEQQPGLVSVPRLAAPA